MNNSNNLHPYFRVIGDVHGQPCIPAYLKRAKKAEYSLQLGDLAGHNYKFLNELDPLHHKVIAGNHEVFNAGSDWYFRNIDHFLGDFGQWTIPNFQDMFYVRGGMSLNKKEKEARGVWSIEEELGVPKLQEAIELYAFLRPEFVVTHECPLSIVQHVANPMTSHNLGFAHSIIRTKTNQALDAMLEIHQPKIWIFGHYHTYMSKHIDGTHFICLNQMPEMGHFIDFPAIGIDEDDEDIRNHNDPNHPFEFDIGGEG